MFLSKCEVFDSTKLKFIKEQKVSTLLSENNSPLKYFPLLGAIFSRYKTNKISLWVIH